MWVVWVVIEIEDLRREGYFVWVEVEEVGCGWLEKVWKGLGLGGNVLFLGCKGENMVCKGLFLVWEGFGVVGECLVYEGFVFGLVGIVL